MKNKEKLTPADYDRWGRVCVKFDDDKITQKAEAIQQTAEEGTTTKNKASTQKKTI